MLVGMAVTTVGAANYAVGSNTSLYNASSIISTGGNCMYVTADASNGYADIKQNDKTTELGTRTFTLSHAYCIMSANGSETSRIAIGTGDGLVAGYDYTNKCFFISKNNELMAASNDPAKYTYKYPYRVVEGCWYYIAFRFTATTAHIYLNGSEILSASYADMGLTRSGWAIYYPKNINFYADNYQFFMDDARVSYSANLGGYTGGTNAVVYAFGASGARASASLGEADVDLTQITCSTVAVNTVSLTQESIGEISFARKAANESGNTGYVVTANDLYNSFLTLVRNAISAAYNAGAGVTAAQINAANDAWALTPADGKSVLAGEGYNHLLGKTNGYYYGANSSQATDAKNKINAIGTVTYTSASKSKIDAARAAYNIVMAYTYDTGYNNDVTNAWVTNAVTECMASYTATLEAAEARYAELEKENSQAAQDQKAADAVISKINAIGTVTYNSKSAIETAESAYGALTDAQKKLVTNYSTLTSARSTYNALHNEVVAYKNAVAALPATATATDACRQAIAACATAYATLTSPGQVDAVKTEKAKYDAFRAEWQAVVADQEAADAVIEKINAIGTVTVNSKSAIEIAEAAYATLTDGQKALVTNYSTLTKARADYNALVENQAKADDVISKIGAIGNVTYTNLSKNMIDAARSAYDDLNDTQKKLVTNYHLLLNAEAKYASLKKAADDKAAADAVIAKIDAIGTVTIDSKTAIETAEAAYTALTDDQKTLVTNYATLTAARDAYNALANEKAAADAVVAKINAIGTVTLASKSAIETAETAYANLSDTAKSFVTNYETLTAARTAYNKAVVTDYNTRATTELKDVTIANKADLLALIDEYNALKSAGLNPTATILPRLNSSISKIEGYEAKVAETIGLIDAIATVTLDSGDKIVAAETAYDALTTQEQKDLISNYATLTAARAAYDALVAADNKAKTDAAAFDAEVDALGEITLDSGAAIDAAYVTYTSLTDEAKAYATKKADLDEAKAIYDALVAEKEAQEQVDINNKVNATSLVISDSLAINYKITVSAGYEIVAMKFELAGTVTTVTEYTTDASGRLVFKYTNIAPNLMGETITSMIVVKDANGKEYTTTGNEYSIAAYVNRKIATEGLTELLASLINYGDAATAYAGNYTAPSTLIDGWANYADDVTPVRDYVSVTTFGDQIKNPAVNFGSANLILTDSVNIRIKLTGDIKDGYYAKALYQGFDYKGLEYTFDIVNDNGVYYIVWDLFNAAQMTNESKVVITVYDENGNAVSNFLRYSVESYVADMLPLVTDNAELTDLLTAMMQYGDIAYRYRLATMNG